MTPTKHCVEIRSSADQMIRRWIVEVPAPETMGDLWKRMPEIPAALNQAKLTDPGAYCSRSSIPPGE